MLEENNSLVYPDSVDEKKVKVLERKLDLQSEECELTSSTVKYRILKRLDSNTMKKNS